MFAFAGPAYLVSVGYMDPGNWATDIEGGARFGYQLLWVLVISNLMAILLQTLSARLGIVSGRDLAQACRESYSRPVSYSLWGLCEIAIASTDLAEVLGAAIGLNLLFGIPLLAGVLITSLDTLLILWLGRFGIRALESVILGFISVIAGCFFLEIFLAKPEFGEVARGLVPRLDGDSLYVAIGILGATVMPHNLYLHSSLVQTRSIGDGEDSKRTACRFNLIDSVIALNGALLVNVAILIVSAATFFKQGVAVTEIQQAHQMLSPLLGTTLASVAFAVALLFSGQSSTITGTMAGQVVMEGFLNFRMRPWLRRLITRAAAIVPAVLVIHSFGEKATYQLLIFSQVVLSLQLPFAVLPLIRFTSDKRRMGVFATPAWARVLAWGAAALILALNGWLSWRIASGWIERNPALAYVLVPFATALAGLLVLIMAEPRLRKPSTASGSALVPESPADFALPIRYQRILVPLDHSGLDRQAVAHALAMAAVHKATIYLLHVEEGVTSQIYGAQSQTAEVEAGRRYFEALAQGVRDRGLPVELRIVHDRDPKSGILAAAASIHPDLLVMGAHGHKGMRDIIFGATINEVRHSVGVPVLIVRDAAPAAEN
jgi:manganese transport protein